MEDIFSPAFNGNGLWDQVMAQPIPPAPAAFGQLPQIGGEGAWTLNIPRNQAIPRTDFSQRPATARRSRGSSEHAPLRLFIFSGHVIRLSSIFSLVTVLGDIYNLYKILYPYRVLRLMRLCGYDLFFGERL